MGDVRNTPRAVVHLCGRQALGVKLADGYMAVLVEGMPLASLAGIAAIVRPHSARGNPAKAEVLHPLAGFSIGLGVEQHPYPPAYEFCIQLTLFAELTYLNDVVLVLVHGLVLSFEVTNLSFCAPAIFRLYTTAHRVASAIYHIPGIL